VSCLRLRVIDTRYEIDSWLIGDPYRRGQQDDPLLRVQALGVPFVWPDEGTSDQAFCLWAGRIVHDGQLRDALAGTRYSFNVLVHGDDRAPAAAFLASCATLQVHHRAAPRQLLECLLSSQAALAHADNARRLESHAEEAALLATAKRALGAAHVVRICSREHAPAVAAALRRLIDNAPRLRERFNFSGVCLAIDDNYHLWDSGYVSIPCDFDLDALPGEVKRLLCPAEVSGAAEAAAGAPAAVEAPAGERAAADGAGVAGSAAPSMAAFGDEVAMAAAKVQAGGKGGAVAAPPVATDAVVAPEGGVGVAGSTGAPPRPPVHAGLADLGLSADDVVSAAVRSGRLAFESYISSRLQRHIVPAPPSGALRALPEVAAGGASGANGAAAASAALTAPAAPLATQRQEPARSMSDFKTQVQQLAAAVRKAKSKLEGTPGHDIDDSKQHGARQIEFELECGSPDSEHTWHAAPAAAHAFSGGGTGGADTPFVNPAMNSETLAAAASVLHHAHRLRVRCARPPAPPQPLAPTAARLTGAAPPRATWAPEARGRAPARGRSASIVARAAPRAVQQMPRPAAPRARSVGPRPPRAPLTGSMLR
jgi:hypothetical protein